jgi:hypothetical protein
MKEKTSTLDRLLFGKAFLLGTIAILWIGFVFVDTNALALTITAIIGGVYTIGIVELLKFRHATSTLSKALDATNETVDVFSKWLDRLDPSLRIAVRRRVEGERVGLPGPVLTPYLLSLLIMLGLLGTFIGMVDTLRGAVIAIEGTAEIQAIRDGLAAPIKGLALSFGTSVAGVATSAMLGLMSTLSRRQRMLETKRLDTKVPTHFRDFSLAHHQRETFKALQIQTQALPRVADKLDAMADKLALLGGTLIKNQDQLHASVKRNFSDLTDSVNKAFKESLANGIRQIGEATEPIVKDAIADITQETHIINRSLTQTAKDNTEEISRLFAAQVEEMAQSWKTGLEAHNHANGELIDRIRRSQNDFQENFKGVAESLVESVNSTSASWIERMEANDKARLDLWAVALGNAQKEAATYLTNASEVLAGDFKQITEIHQAAFDAVTQDLVAVSSDLAVQWRKTGEDTRAAHKQTAESLKQMTLDLASSHQTTASTIQKEVTRLLTSSEDLVQSRIETEARWVDGHQKRLDTLTETLGAELGKLREDEEVRAQAAAARFENLESVLVSHLTTLGQALEAPMARLIQTATEAPRAAVDVIEMLRQTASKHIQRDNRLLEEHRCTIERLDNLLSSLDLRYSEQGEAIGQLINTSKSMMEDLGRQFTLQVDTEITKISEVADTFAGSAVEMASLGDAFSVAIELFNTSNGSLIENLARIEDALEKVSTRSDDQLGYYVAQARELIDHSILSQKEIVLSLQQLRPQHAPDLEAN